MYWVTSIFVLILISSSCLGIRKHIKAELLRTHQRDSLTVLEAYLSYQHLGIDKKGENPCEDMYKKNLIRELKNVNVTKVTSEVIINGHEGFILMLDNTTDIPIPVAIKCSIHDANGPVMIGDNSFDFYFVIIEENDKISKFIRADIHGEINGITVLALRETIDQSHLKTMYENHYNDINDWLQNYKKIGLLNELCEKLDEAQPSSGGISAASAKLIDGPFGLRLDDQDTITIPAVIECKMKILDGITSMGPNIGRKTYYACVYDKFEEIVFSLYGPKNIDGQQTFAIAETIL